MTEFDTPNNPYAAPRSNLPDAVESSAGDSSLAFDRIAQGLRFVGYSVLLSAAAVVFVGGINLSVRGQLVPEEYMKLNVGILAGGFGLAWLLSLAGCMVCLEVPARVGVRNLMLPAAMLETGRTFVGVLWAQQSVTVAVALLTIACVPGATFLFVLGLVRLSDYVGLQDHADSFRRVLLAMAIGLVVTLTGILLGADRGLSLTLIVMWSAAAIAIGYWYISVLFRLAAALRELARWQESREK
jgi:hypothetical protein